VGEARVLLLVVDDEAESYTIVDCEEECGVKVV
jgi:hypothetical protein